MSREEAPNANEIREAVAALRGYAYQIAVTAIAWVQLKPGTTLFLEVAEDYAEVADRALKAVQVKHVESGEKITLNTRSVLDAIEHFIELRKANPDRDVTIHYLTTAEIGTERSLDDRLGGQAGLHYWRSAAATADISPLRERLTREDVSPIIKAFVDDRTDQELREELLRKIYWDTQNADLESAISQLENDLVQFGREHFGLASQDCKTLSNTVLFAVLARATDRKRERRSLIAEDLFQLVEGATRVSVSRPDLQRLLALVAQAAPLTGGQSTALVSTPHPPWVYLASESMPAQLEIERGQLVKAITEAMQPASCAILVGATGLGKSILAQSVASSLKVPFSIVDFRDIDRADTRKRIDFLAAHAAEFGGLLILDDLNQLSDPGVIKSMARLLLSLRLRNVALIATCYQKPAPSLTAHLGLPLNSVVEIPYFERQEVAALVQLAGGDKRWANVAFLAGGGGHPQLTNAYVTGAAARGWPSDELSQFVEAGFGSSDINALRDATRRRLIDELPVSSRSLLYRLSIVANSFTRELAVELGSVVPQIDRPGEAVDLLTGPWLETPQVGRLRVSPLAANSGMDVLGAEEKTATHVAIVRQLLKNRKLSIGDADTVLLHAISGNDDRGLMAAVMATLTANQETLEAINDYTVVIANLRTDQPVYPRNLALSVMLRMAQFKVSAVRPEKGDLNSIAAALLREVALMPEEIRDSNELVSLSLMLITPRAATYLDNWVILIGKFCEAIDEEAEVGQHLRKERPFAPEFSSQETFLVAAGLMNLPTVSKLENIFDQFAVLAKPLRDRLLADYKNKPGSFDITCGGAWLSEATKGTLVGVEAAASFARIADKFAGWGYPELAVIAVRAQSVMLDEYGGASEQALRLIDDADRRFGAHDYLIRSRLKIESRRGNDRAVIDLTKEVSEWINKGEPLERAFVLRESAICAYRQQEWELAASWFHQAAAAVRTSPTDQEALALGLEIDAAVALFKGQSVKESVQQLLALIEKLKTISSDTSLRAIYTRHIIRHAILTVKSAALHQDAGAFPWLPGAGSNMEPSQEFHTRPLGPIDFSLYMLAEIDINLDLGLKVSEILPTLLGKGPIPIAEFGLSRDSLAAALKRQDAKRYARGMRKHVSIGAYLQRYTVPKGPHAFDVFNPERAEIELLTPAEIVEDDFAANSFRNLIFYYVLGGLLSGQADVSTLELELISEFGHDSPRADIFYAIRGEITLADPTEAEQVLKIRSVLSGNMNARDVCAAGLRFFEFLHRGEFSTYLVSLLGTWLSTHLRQILSVGRFGLINPSVTAPEIEEILSNETNDRAYVVKLLLSFSDAVGLRLGGNYKEAVLSPT